MCEHMRLAKELDRARRLAKGLAVMEGTTVVIFQKTDGSYDFTPESDFDKSKGEIVEYITRY